MQTIDGRLNFNFNNEMKRFIILKEETYFCMVILNGENKYAQCYFSTQFQNILHFSIVSNVFKFQFIYTHSSQKSTNNTWKRFACIDDVLCLRFHNSCECVNVTANC